MPKIIFKGKEYDTIDAMPPNERQAYQQQMRNQIGQNMDGQYESNLDHIPSEVQDIYDQVLGRLQEKAAPPARLDNLPSTQDLYNRASASSQRNLGPDQNTFRPSPPLIDNSKSAIEAEGRIRQLALRVFLIAIILVIIFAAVSTLLR